MAWERSAHAIADGWEKLKRFLPVLQLKRTEKNMSDEKKVIHTVSWTEWVYRKRKGHWEGYWKKFKETYLLTNEEAKQAGVLLSEARKEWRVRHASVVQSGMLNSFDDLKDRLQLAEPPPVASPRKPRATKKA